MVLVALSAPPDDEEPDRSVEDLSGSLVVGRGAEAQRGGGRSSRRSRLRPLRTRDTMRPSAPTAMRM